MGNYKGEDRIEKHYTPDWLKEDMSLMLSEFYKGDITDIEQHYKTMISQLTIEELILFKNTSPMIDDYEWNFIWDEIIPNKSGSVYEEIKYYYNIRVLPFIR